MSLRKLLDQRDHLIKKNQQLRLEYEEKNHNSQINDIIASMNRTNIRGGKYGQLIHHPEYRTKWKGTFFDTQRPLIESMDAYPLDRIELFKNGNKDNPFSSDMNKECQWQLIGYCDIVAPSKHGPVIRITDPYGSFTFPLTKTPFEEASKFVGRILVVSASFCFGRQNPKVIRVQVLKFSLKEDFRDVAI